MSHLEDLTNRSELLQEFGREGYIVKPDLFNPALGFYLRAGNIPIYPTTTTSPLADQLDLCAQDVRNLMDPFIDGTIQRHNVPRIFAALRPGAQPTANTLKFKNANGFTQVETFFPITEALFRSYQSEGTIDPNLLNANEDVVLTLDAYTSLFNLLKMRDMLSIFELPGNKRASHFRIVFSHYLPGATVQNLTPGMHHKDHFKDAAVISIQLSELLTRWEIGRNKHLLEPIEQPWGGMVAMDAAGGMFSNRHSPYHHPLVTDAERLSVVLVLHGEYRHNFYEWLDEYGLSFDLTSNFVDEMPKLGGPEFTGAGLSRMFQASWAQ